MKMHTTTQGFTLSELLVSLAVLGLIAAFAVPKVLNAVGNSSTLAIAKETISTITTAYDGVKADSTVASVPSSTQAWRLIDRLNYVRTAAGSTTAAVFATSPTACVIPTTNSTTATPCQILMHNGAVLGIDLIDSFNDNSGTVGPSAPNRGKMMFTVDPDGAGDMEPAVFALGFDGRLMAGANAVSTADTGVYGYGTPQATGSIITDQTDANGANTIANGATENHANSWFAW